MTEQQYKVKVTATGEVRDAAGNLISTSPIEAEMTVSEAQARELGYTIEGESP